MNDPLSRSGEVDSDDHDDLAQLARHLRESRPRPESAFVSRLRRRVIDLRSSVSQPAWRVRARIAGWAFAGGLLLLLGAIGAAGAGPFGG